jgi:hypothetical protein
LIAEIITGGVIAVASYSFGIFVCLNGLKNVPQQEKPDPYDKYRNKDGLLSRRKVKESG